MRKQYIAFAEEYVIDFNGAQACIRAGYSAKGANVKGAQLLAITSIQEYVAKLLKGRSERTEITQDRVLLEIARLAFNDPRKLFNDNGDLLPVNEFSDESAAAISSIKITETISGDDSLIQVKEVRFWDKGRQLELAAKHLGMLAEKPKTVELANPVILTRVVTKDDVAND